MAHIQTVSAQNTVIAANLTAGHSVILQLMDWDLPAGTHTLVSSQPGDVMVLGRMSVGVGNLLHVTQWYCLSVTGGNTTFTFGVTSGSFTTPEVFLSEFDALTGIDQSQVNTDGSGGAATVSTGLSPTTTELNELLVGGLVLRGGTFGTVLPGTSANGYNIPTNGSRTDLVQGVVEYQYVTSMAQYQADFVRPDNSNYWGAVLGTYKVAPVAPSGPTPIYVTFEG